MGPTDLLISAVVLGLAGWLLVRTLRGAGSCAGCSGGCGKGSGAASSCGPGRGAGDGPIRLSRSPPPPGTFPPPPPRDYLG
ncbi:MAG: hypothetical protein QM767_04005 [Anaeromyxobacter sp.]